MSPEQVRKIIEAVENFQGRIVLLTLALSGLRIGELLALKWISIDFAGNCLRLPHSLWRGNLFSPKSETIKRAIHLPDSLASELRGYHHLSRWTGLDDFVFCQADGKPHTPEYARYEILYPALERAGIKREKGIHGFHLFRHSTTTILDGETQSFRAARDLLGHTAESITAGYARTPRDTVKATEILARKIAGNRDLTVAETSTGIQWQCCKLVCGLDLYEPRAEHDVVSITQSRMEEIPCLFRSCSVV